MRSIKFPVLILVVLTLASFIQAQRSECFPVERLPPDARKRSEALLLKAMDEAALFTLVGGIKPMSTGIKSLQMQVSLPAVSIDDSIRTIADLGAKPADTLTAEEKTRLAQAKQANDRARVLDEVRDLREILETWRCGDEVFAGVQFFANTFEGKRSLDVVVFNRPTLRKTLAQKADFFSRWGLTANAHPLDVLYAIEHERSSARFAGYGYLFGYPDHAVRFFVQAADEETFTGRFVARDFYSIPTHARDTNFFVYAVPKGYVPSDVDKSIKERAETVLKEYRKRRGEYIGDGKRGIVELIRDWFCQPDAGCSPSNARF